LPRGQGLPNRVALEQNPASPPKGSAMPPSGNSFRFSTRKKTRFNFGASTYNRELAMKFFQGERVRHPNRPDWGIGQVLADGSGENVRVFFVGAGEKNLKSAVVNLLKVQGPEASHPLLDNLIIVRTDKGTKYRSLPILKGFFLKEFPQGFNDETYLDAERDYKVKAHELMGQLLGKVVFRRLLSSGEFDDICSRALTITNKTNLIFPNEKMSLRDGIREASSQRRFSESLFNLLYGDGDLKGRFESFADCLTELKAAKWTTLTYFPFIADPSSHMFLKPEVTQKASEVCGFELNYRSQPNWLTYSKLLDFSQYLFDYLSDLSPRDMIDVQSFIWSSAKIAEGEY
jgi:hypothetical protein